MSERERIIRLILNKFYKHKKYFNSSYGFQITRLLFLHKFLVNDNQLKYDLISFILEDIIENNHTKNSTFPNKKRFLSKIYKEIKNPNTKVEFFTKYFDLLHSFQAETKRVSTHATRYKIIDEDLNIFRYLLYIGEHYKGKVFFIQIYM